MIKFINILTNVISEQKRYKLDPEVYTKLMELSDRLWASRNKPYTKKTLVDQIPFKTDDGADGLVKIIISPRLKYIAFMDTKPPYSRDPMDFEMQLNPKEYGNKKNLFLTMYHEMMHATDPTQSTKTNMKYNTSYNPEDDTKYWGHPIEFKAIANEFLEGLVLEFNRRNKRLRNINNKKILIKSLNNILNYFATGEQLSKTSLDIIERINDEYVDENKISQILGNIKTDYPLTSELLPNKNEPFFLTYVQKIKKFNPSIWPKFLTMLYKTKDEIINNLN